MAWQLLGGLDGLGMSWIGACHLGKDFGSSRKGDDLLCKSNVEVGM